MRTSIAVLKMIEFALICLIIVPAQAILLLFHKGKYAYTLPYLFHKSLRYIFGIKINIEGTQNTLGQTIFMSNHLSYLDIILIGGVIKNASFVAKEDVAKWPVFGYLATLQQTAFISRSRTKAVQGRNMLENMLKDGRNLIIFPEGTSTDGRDVYPFKSSLFTIAYYETAKDLYVQPVTLNLNTTNGKELTSQETRDLYAWHLNMDMELPPHLWRFARSSGASLSIIFHPPLKASEFKDRKVLAKACHDNVINGLTTKVAA